MKWHNRLDTQTRELLVEFILQGRMIEEHEIFVAQRMILQMAVLLDNVEEGLLESDLGIELPPLARYIK